MQRQSMGGDRAFLLWRDRQVIGTEDRLLRIMRHKDRHGAALAPDAGGPRQPGQALMKSRTNGVAGRTRISAGLPICSILPPDCEPDITTTRSASSIASS